MPLVTLGRLGRVGLVKDTPDQGLPPEAWTFVQNARFDERGVVSFLGHQEVMTPASITPLWLKQFPTTLNPIWVYADLNQVFALEAGVHTDITRISGTYNGVDGERWQGEVFSGVGIFNNAVDSPQVWGPMASSQRLVDLPNWPAGYTAKFIRPFGVFLVAGNIFDGVAQRPFRLKWSHPAVPGSVPTSWDATDPATDAGERDLGITSDELVDGLSLGDIFIIYRENSTWGMRFIGRPDIFQTWQITQESGILARDCVLDTPQGHFVVTEKDVVLHQGTKASFQSLVETQLRRWLFSQVDSTYFYNCFVVRNAPMKEIWFCFPEKGEVYANLALVWSWAGKGIGVRSLPNVPFAWGGVVPAGGSGEDASGV